MKRFLILLLALVAVSASGQVTTPNRAGSSRGGVSTPERRALLYPTTGLKYLLIHSNYSPNPGGTATLSDVSPNGWHLTQSVETKKPTKTPYGLYFDGGDNLSISGNTWVGSASGFLAVYSLFNVSNSATNTTLFDTSAVESASNSRFVFYWSRQSDGRLFPQHSRGEDSAMGGSGFLFRYPASMTSHVYSGTESFENIVAPDYYQVSNLTVYDIYGASNREYTPYWFRMQQYGTKGLFLGSNYLGGFGMVGYIKYLVIYSTGTTYHNTGLRNHLRTVFMMKSERNR